MPKEVLRSGPAANPAATTAAVKTSVPAIVKPATPAGAVDPLADMETRLRAMNLDETLIQAALAKEKERLAKAAGLAKPAVSAPAATITRPTPAEKPTNAAVTGQGNMSDEEFAKRVQQEYDQSGGEGGDQLPPEEEKTPAAGIAEGAAPDAAHDDEETGGRVVMQNHWSKASDGAITGPIDRNDFKTPQLKLIQGSGPLSKKFNQGTLIFMDQTIFSAPDPDKPGPPLSFIPVAIAKYFRENLPQDQQVDEQGKQRIPRTAYTPEDVQRLGGTLEFGIDTAGQRTKPTWGPAARCVVIIERPEGNNHPGFAMPVEINGAVRLFAPAVLFVNGGQYRAFVKPIMDATNFILCEGTGVERKILLEKRFWQLQVVKELSGTNMVFNPRIAMLPEATTAELRDYAVSLRGA